MQFRRFSDLVYRRSGIHLSEGKRSLLQARLSKRLRAVGIDSVEDYFGRLETDEREVVAFLDAISTNHTYFFRESRHFQMLQEDHRCVWCAACSSGEEPYSIAIHCLEKGFRPSILATDISTKVLAVAEKGIYDAEKAKQVPSDLLRKYFQRGVGTWGGRIRVKQDIQRMVAFKRLNLLTDPLPEGRFDVIFCRNVLIYFDRTVKEEVVNKLHQALRPSGYFIVGGAESLNNLRHPYRYIAPSIYMKPSP